VSEENIFGNQTPDDPNKEVPAVPPIQIPTEVSELVGAGKKYQTVEEALKSVPHAQTHIKTLESEMANLKEELAKRKTAEELLENIKLGIQHETTPPAANTFDPSQISDIVNQSLEQRERASIAKQNTNSVVSKFTEKFGEKAEEAFVTLAKESGLTVQQLNTLASTSPSAVLKLAGLSNTPVTPGSNSGSINTEALKNAGRGDLPSARVPKGATTKDLVAAWKAAGEKVKTNLNN
jgi:hypothetical protein